MHVGRAPSAECILFNARIYWPKVIYNKSTYAIRRVDGAEIMAGYSPQKCVGKSQKNPDARVTKHFFYGGTF